MQKKSFFKRKIRVFLLLLLTFLAGCGLQIESSEIQDNGETASSQTAAVAEGQNYTSKEDVAAYIHEYGALPPNYITKKEARALGWDNQKGNLWDVTDELSIGGDYFGNREGQLPETDQNYYEADIDYAGGFRGPERLVYTGDGSIVYYTDDHYETFEQLY